MSPDWGTVFIVGPPAAGKSTIGRAVAKALNATFRTIDDWTPRGEPMTDAQVQLALARLFRATKPTNEIVEVCYHDYVSLFDKAEYKLFKSSRKVFVTAPLTLCEARNAVRISPVRTKYVERVWFSTQSLLHECSTVDTEAFIVIDTATQSVKAAIAAVIGYVTRKEYSPC